MLQLKFSPFIRHIEILNWKYKGGAKFEFYSSSSGLGGTNEHAIVEISFDRQTGDIMKKYQELINVKFSTEATGNKSGQKLFCTEAFPGDVRIMDHGGISYSDWRQSGFKSKN